MDQNETGKSSPGQPGLQATWLKQTFKAGACRLRQQIFSNSAGGMLPIGSRDLCILVCFFTTSLTESLSVM
jgi:hypothetical protein